MTFAHVSCPLRCRRQRSGLSGRTGITPGVSSSEMGKGCTSGFMDFKSGKERAGKERQQVRDSLDGKQRWSRAGKKGSGKGGGLGL